MLFIEGYSQSDSVEQGEDIRLCVSTNAPSYSVDAILEGPQPEQVQHRIEKIAGAEQAAPEMAYSKGCSWPVTVSIPTGSGWPSGIYTIRLTANQPPGDYQHFSRATAQYEFPVAVRAKEPGHKSSILLPITTNTYQAYTHWGGRSLYDYNSREKIGSKVVSFDRPIWNQFPRWERPFIQWAWRNGIPLEYACNYDLEARPEMLEQYRLVMSVGHDEYWSGAMRRNVEAYIRSGGNYCFLCGDSVTWQVQFEDGGRRMHCVKHILEADPAYHEGRMRDITTRFNHPLVGWPENSLRGVTWDQGGYHLHGRFMDGTGAYTEFPQPNHWVFEGTGLAAGDEFGGADTIVGYETDGCYFEERDGLPYPTGADGTAEDFVILAQAPASAYDGHQGMATMGIYERRGIVFTASTTDWAHGLSDPVVERITLNVIKRLSA